ncbi:NACHT domain-containing protein [Nonomuraea purpurea]|uniref:NACHT domain-containing protein n=1 Tax=Nonomuraea purpurea TaxID=1849276 RepID=A0ABV8G702_9ACTN
MRTGRPPSAERKRYPELEPIADWFVQAIDEFGHGSIRRTAEMTGLSQRSLYDAVNAERMLPLRLVRALAEGLGRDPEEITRLWGEAKQERDRAEEAERRRTHPSLTSWEDIPLPTPALRDLLEAQNGMFDCLPYSLLGLVEPPLSAIYVQQHIRRHLSAGPDTAGDEAAAREEGGLRPAAAHHEDVADVPARTLKNAALDLPAADTILSLSDALARFDHLLIIGEAGAGKSTLANHMVRSLCGVWLRRTSFLDAPVAEPVLPLRLSASLLVVEQGSWSERLRRATLSALGGGLVADPPSTLFAGRTQGARWLIFVDGIDEIADRRQRAELIRTLSWHSRRESDFRLVVMSRSLPGAEFAPLLDARVGEFEIRPFKRPELEDYTRKWFDQQHTRVHNPSAAADRFLREVVDEGDLQELVHNPLMATMALTNATLEPSLPPSSSRLALYDSFLQRLRNRATHSSADLFPSWLSSVVDRLVRHLARQRTEGEEDLVASGRTWLRQHSQDQLPAGWEAELPTALGGTGLLVVAGDQVRFLHQSFAEFLAAAEYARELPVDDSGLELWIRRACEGTQRTLALFVLCQWAAREESASDLLIDRLFAYPSPTRTLLAGSLLTEGLEVRTEQANEVIQRLVALVRGDDNNLSTKAADALSALDVGFDTTPVLRQLVEACELPADTRFHVLRAYSRFVPPTVAGQLLTGLLESLYSLLPKAALLAQQLDDESRRAVRQRLKDLVCEPDADAWESAIAAEAYLALEATDEVERWARDVLASPWSGPHNLRRAADAWLASSPASIAVAELGMARPPTDHAGRLTIAQALEHVGATREASALVRTILDARDNTMHDQVLAAEMWLRTHGSHAVEPVRQLLDWYESIGVEVWRRSRLIQVMIEAGAEYPTVEWARRQLSGEQELPLIAEEVIQLWIENHAPVDLDEVMSLIGDGIRLHRYGRADAAEILLQAGFPDKALQVAELALRSPSARSEDYRIAANVLIKIDRKRTIGLLTAQFAKTGMSSWGAGVLDALRTDGQPDLDELRLRIADHVLGLTDAEGSHVQRALIEILILRGRDRFDAVVEHVCHYPILTGEQLCELAKALAAIGEAEMATTIWRYVLSVRGRGSDGFGIELLEDIGQALTFTVAKQLVEEQLAGEPTPHQRRRLERMLAWLATSPVRA